jgi:thioredoxin 1
MVNMVTDATFEAEVLKSDLPVLVDFFAEWCGPCRSIAPMIDELAAEYEGKFKIVKLNIDENQEVTAKYGVMSIPTLIIFKAGASVEQVVGARGKDDLKELLDKNVK